MPAKGYRRVSTPTILQMESVECGPTSLAIVLAYYGKRVTLEELRVACGVTRDGSTAGNMVRAARAYGLEAHGYRRDVSEVAEMKPPFVIFWRFNHFLVVEGFSKAGVHLNDPASGRRIVDHEDFDRSYTGIAIALAPGDGFEREPSGRVVLSALARYLRGGKSAIVFSLFCGLGLVVPGILIPAFVRLFVDGILTRGDNALRLPILGGIAVALVVQLILLGLQQRVIQRLQTKLAVTNTASFFSYLMRLPMSFFGQRSPGELQYRVQLNDRVADLLSQRLLTTLAGFVATAFYLALMLYDDVTLTLVVVAITATNVIALALLARSREAHSVTLQHETGRLYGRTIEGIASIETLKASGAEDGFFRRWSGYQALVINARQRYAIPTQVLGTIPEYTAALTAIAVLGFGGWRFMDGALSLGTLVSFQLLAAQFAAPFATIVALAADVQAIAGHLAKLEDVYRYPVPERSPAFDPAAHATAGRIEARSIAYRYSPVGNLAVDDLSFTLEPGARIAFVGKTGGGKSSIARLLARLDAPTGGTLSLDGRPFATYSEEAFARAVAFVDQTIALFPGTIRENITLWDHTISDEAVERAARDAGIYDDILARPGAFDALVAEGGANFSGGQRQRLEIARALSRDPLVLILDEATSALDTLAEHNVAESLRARGCACIVIAHRLSTVRDCDEIIVVDHGRVVERGTHAELVARGNHYFGLVNAA